MNRIARNPSAARRTIAQAGLALMLAAGAPALGQTVTAASLVERAQIEDLLTRLL